jgi:hypothetical protein
MHIYLYILSAFLQYLADSLFITLVDKSVDWELDQPNINASFAS